MTSRAAANAWLEEPRPPVAVPLTDTWPPRAGPLGNAATPVFPGSPLDALRMSWGDVYDIGHEYDRWVASRRDDRGGTLEGTTPDELNRQMRADWGIR
jgi:hypothetical protein